MEDPEYRVFVRIPIPRPPGFVDPPSFIWNAEKESGLWKVISRRTRGDINCTSPEPRRPNSAALQASRFQSSLLCLVFWSVG